MSKSPTPKPLSVKQVRSLSVYQMEWTTLLNIDSYKINLKKNWVFTLSSYTSHKLSELNFIDARGIGFALSLLEKHFRVEFCIKTNLLLLLLVWFSILVLFCWVVSFSLLFVFLFSIFFFFFSFFHWRKTIIYCLSANCFCFCCNFAHF